MTLTSVDVRFQNCREVVGVHPVCDHDDCNALADWDIVCRALWASRRAAFACDIHFAEVLRVYIAPESEAAK